MITTQLLPLPHSVRFCSELLGFHDCGFGLGIGTFSLERIRSELCDLAMMCVVQNWVYDFVGVFFEMVLKAEDFISRGCHRSGAVGQTFWPYLTRT
eukprot:scaffold29486_cov61-Cyclotella_meneghiniana.AAC.2